MIYSTVSYKSLPPKPGMTASTCPPKRTDFDSPPASAKHPWTRPGAGNPQSRFVNRVPQGKGERTGGKEGGSCRPLAGIWRSQRGAVISLSLEGGREGGGLGSPRGCRHSNQTERMGGATSPFSHLLCGGNSPNLPYLELVSKTA